jgi:hypothetical protein
VRLRAFRLRQNFLANKCELRNLVRGRKLLNRGVKKYVAV